jgi:DNA topoisomerase I
MFDAEVHVSVDVAISAPPGLRYVCDDGPAIRRKKAGKGFFYVDSRGNRVTDPALLKRIRSLVIPPAWTDVWICPSADGHIQATGRDAKRRKQYRYHADYREAQEQSKYERLTEFAEALPTIRATVAEHMSLRGLPREKILATVVHLLETTLIRVGNDEYARTNQSYGLTTLKSEHVEVEGSEVRFQFTGKIGKQWSLAMRDRRVARIIRACQELPGQDLLQYLDEDKELRAVSSGDVNAYLREITGGDITAKDFRTWAGTVLMARFLKQSGAFESVTQAKRALTAAVKQVAQALGNTPAVCRKSYIHPAICSAYLDCALVLEAVEVVSGRSERTGLRPEEAAVLALLSGGQSGAPHVLKIGHPIQPRAASMRSVVA